MAAMSDKMIDVVHFWLIYFNLKFKNDDRDCLFNPLNLKRI